MTSLKIVSDEVVAFAYELDRVQDLKTLAEDAKRAFETAQADLIEQMKDQELFEVDTPEWHATLVQGHSTKVSEEGLMSWVNQNNPALISDLMKYQMDRKQLERVIEKGLIPMTVVNTYVTTQQNKPYLRITERQIDPDAG